MSCQSPYRPRPGPPGGTTRGATGSYALSGGVFFVVTHAAMVVANFTPESNAAGIPAASANTSVGIMSRQFQQN
jgi:hypothetical protein